MNKYISINQIIFNMLLHQIMKLKIIIKIQNGSFNEIFLILKKMIIKSIVKLVI